MNTNLLNLAARVKAVNTAHAKAIEVYRAAAPVFIPLVGQKIIKADGHSLMQKYESLVPKFETTPNIRIWRHRAELWWGISANESTPDDKCFYHELCVYVGHLSNGVLTEMYPEWEWKHDYTVEEIVAKREKCEALEKQYNEAKSALNPFGEYDR